MSTPEKIAIAGSCIALLIAITNTCVTIYLFYRKRRCDLTDNRCKAAVMFFSKIDECLADIRHLNTGSTTCVCHESYANFRLTLNSEQATDLDRCWRDYIATKKSGEDTAKTSESLECLKLCIHEFTGT